MWVPSPPQNFEEAIPEFEENKLQKFTENPIYHPTNEGSDEWDTAELMMKQRTHYTRQMEKEQMEKLVKQKTHELMERISQLQSSDEIVSFIEQQQKTRREIAKYTPGGSKLCSIPNCHNYCYREYDYCLDHIFNDQNQNLLTKCEGCGRAVLKGNKCFLCNK
ncbi:hypothetical protein GPJ56_009104 [Histomonas meleagridis]|uniref:uncharacterized protein n=1 Tax=Histomonas meleagridis TaxID=135588 RepID=UPI00355A0F7C|nr:hypothetical protein GPJ56_009104 [Histomonas meleagridis]KAH0799239.1 hypothetical protein GO595_008036 [Histomonas meleagridis]